MLRSATGKEGQKALPNEGYNARRVSRNRLVVVARSAGLGLVALGTAGCSLSMKLPSFQSEPEMTASVTPATVPLSPNLDAEDWRRAQAAFSLAVDPQGSGQVVNWENPATKRKGSFIPAGNLVLAEDTVCRPFRATLVEQTNGKPVETHHIGRACRTGPGEWAMREVAPEGAATASVGAGKAPLKLEAAQPLPAATSAMLPEKKLDE